jgi:hypothetical protein
VIVTAYDLGSVPILFRKPKTYAKFLGEEDRYVWTDELLVVMPNGYGISKARGLPAADQATIDSLKPPNTTNGTALVVAAENAVRALAARHGITLDAVPGQPSNSTFDQQRIEIAAAILLAGLIAVAIRLGWRRPARR